MQIQSGWILAHAIATVCFHTLSTLPFVVALLNFMILFFSCCKYSSCSLLAAIVQFCDFNATMFFSHLATVRFFNCTQYGHVVEQHQQQQQQHFFFPAFDCWFGEVFVCAFLPSLVSREAKWVKAKASRAMQSRGQFFNTLRGLLWIATMREKREVKMVHLECTNRTLPSMGIKQLKLEFDLCKYC